jgi:hypothetical protein
MRVLFVPLRLAVIFWNVGICSHIRRPTALFSRFVSAGRAFLSFPFCLKWLTKLRIIIYETWTTVLEEIQHKAYAIPSNNIAG